MTNALAKNDPRKLPDDITDAYRATDVVVVSNADISFSIDCKHKIKLGSAIDVFVGAKNTSLVGR